VADQIAAGRCLAGGVTIRLDEHHLIAGGITQLWNLTSRLQKLLAGSFIFVEAKSFRELGGFSLELFASEELELSQRLKALAKRLDRKIVILHRHPIRTSARKMRLYTWREHLKLLTRIAINRRTLTKREDCILWYDGRR
jgi:vacuolar-type H+-ATPase subunit F/Vma7